MKNYLPFAVREIRTSAAVDPNTGAGAPSSVQISSLDVGFGDRAILGDLNVYAYTAQGEPATHLLMRVGWLGKGFLLEKRLPAGLFVNKSRPGVPVWKFPRPYILWPNQNLRARIDVNNDRNIGQGIMFSGVRLKDNRPQLLYGTREQAITAGGAVGLGDRELRCPGDSPIALHSVTIANYLYDKAANSSVVQIWSPQGREWFQANPFAGPPPPANQNWIDPPTGLLALGEERGWVIDTGQTFIVEYENTGAVAINVITTLRGSVEVEDHHG